MFDRARGISRLTLRRASRHPTWFAVGWRVAAVIAVIVFIIAFHWFERDGLYDTHDGHVSFLDAVYFTMISATTTGYGDVVPVSTEARMFDAFVVTPIRIFLLLIFIGSAYLFVARNYWEAFVMKRIQRDLCGHVIVTGFGVKNRRAVEELINLKVDPRSIVVIDRDADALTLAESYGCTVLQGDSTRDETLRAVHIERARLLIISAGRDDTSILICLTARDLAPELRISIAVNEQDNEAPARRAGADVVVNPLTFAGLLLATSHGSQHIADYLVDLASQQGKVQLVERPVEPDEVGKSLDQIKGAVGLRVFHEGKPSGSWQTQRKTLRAGDLDMEIKETA
jgi:voltage-gated potassium channel